MSTRDYQIESVLGSGGFGTVYRVRDRDGRDKVLKVVRDNTFFLNEGRALAALSNESRFRKNTDYPLGCHPNIVCLTDVYSDSTTNNIVMESLDNNVALNRVMHSGLASILDTHPDGSEYHPANGFEFCKLLLEIGRALVYMHDKGYAHLDIKPENILYHINEYQDPVFKLGDLGLTCNDVCYVGGTADYAAPEILALKRSKLNMMSINEALPADVWSYGATMLELLYGTNPVVAGRVVDFSDTDGMHYEKLFPKEFEYPSELGESISRILYRCLEVDPTQRPTMNQIYSELRAVIKPRYPSLA